MAESQDKPLAGYETLLCVTGGIACYKSADLASRLVQAGAGVSVAMTEAATRFVAPLTFQTLIGRQVFSGLWAATEDYRCGHLALNEQADLIIVAPATANIIAKMACGIADDLVSTLALSAGDRPILIAPAMNTRMLNAQATQTNIATLADRGVHRIGPAEGRLACGDTGPGRMAEPDQILAAAREILKQNPPRKRG